MTSEDNMREEFEAWDRSTFGSDAEEQAKDEHGEYEDAIIRQCWMAWKSSRESLVIRVNSAACHDATAGDVLDAIENSGIKWEVE